MKCIYITANAAASRDNYLQSDKRRLPLKGYYHDALWNCSKLGDEDNLTSVIDIECLANLFYVHNSMLPYDTHGEDTSCYPDRHGDFMCIAGVIN